MALRALDNAGQRPKTYVKIAISAHKEKQQPDLGVNDDNRVPFPAPYASIDYIPSEKLKPFEDPNSKIQGLVGGLESKDWLKVCESLNDVRRLALFHSGLLQPILEKVLLLILKSIKNPRSFLCKTSIMAAADFFNAFGENLLESASDAFSQLLLQLLLKASQEKKFICEEADRALLSMVKSMAPLPLFNKLGAYVGHSNFRVRAKAAVSICYCVSKMDQKSMEESWLKPLLVMALKLLTDKLPETRGAGRKLVVRVYLAITHFPVTPQSWEENDFWESETKKYWQNFCQSNLPASDALAMLEFDSKIRGY